MGLLITIISLVAFMSIISLMSVAIVTIGEEFKTTGEKVKD